MYNNKKNPLEKFSAQIGELAQHYLSQDESVVKTSMWYYDILDAMLKRNFDSENHKNPKYLEVACYRHILGYKLTHERQFDSTLFDLSDRDLELGREYAEEIGYSENVERVAGDFHSLPFSDNYFDVAFVSASIHHTLTPEILIGEMMRVLKEGGIFYCQREPCERLFCFYLFNANRPQQYTPMESRIHQRGTMRLFSSPFPGARNAQVFGRIENDRIPLDRYYEIFSQYGDVVEEVLYHDGLLTRLDKEILEKEDLPEQELAELIYNLVLHEVLIMEKSMGVKERLLGYSVPSQVATAAMARRVASALKARDYDKNSIEWQRQMVRIFGGSLRFVVRRKRDESRFPNNIFNDKRKEVGASSKYLRSCTTVGSVLVDDAVYNNSGLELWNKLLPDIQVADKEDLYEKAFVKTDWEYRKNSMNEYACMVSIAESPCLELRIGSESVTVLRYSVLLDETLPAATLQVACGDNEVMEIFLPQTEDRMMRIFCDGGNNDLRFSLINIAGDQVTSASRIKITILQSIPLHSDASENKV